MLDYFALSNFVYSFIYLFIHLFIHRASPYALLLRPYRALMCINFSIELHPLVAWISTNAAV